MKQDYSLIRLILAEIEGFETYLDGHEIKIDGYTADEINYQLLILSESGLIQAFAEKADDQVQYYPTRLTWEGHEFYNSIRDDERWSYIHKTLSAIGGFAYPIIHQLAIAYIKQKIGLP
jgi:hypothetical protein